jgi:hypothetical protein
MSKCFIMVFDDFHEAEARKIAREADGFSCSLLGGHTRLDIGDSRGQTTTNLLFATDPDEMWVLVAEK